MHVAQLAHEQCKWYVRTYWRRTDNHVTTKILSSKANQKGECMALRSRAFGTQEHWYELNSGWHGLTLFVSHNCFQWVTLRYNRSLLRRNKFIPTVNFSCRLKNQSEFPLLSSRSRKWCQVFTSLAVNVEWYELTFALMIWASLGSWACLARRIETVKQPFTEVYQEHAQWQSRTYWVSS